MKRTTQNNGFILLLVVPIIALIGMVLAIITTNCHSLIIHTRREGLRLKAENACLSGSSWIQQNHEQVQSLVPEKPIILTLEDNLRPVTCRIERIDDRSGGEILRITGHAQDGRFTVDVKQTKAIPISP